MVLARLVRPGVGRSRKWAPSALRIVQKQQARHNTPYMPWPFDTFQKPGSAKYWLSKHPATDASQDEYERELIYIDELDKRIQTAQKNYQPSQKWKDAYNEYAWVNDDPVTESYGSIAGLGSEEIAAKYGRGNKIDPSHYINPKFYKQDRVVLPNPYVHPDLRKRMGPLRNLLAIPPEEASVFKLWNPYIMLGSIGTIMISKEYFIISHDFWHAILFWACWSFIITVGVDWATWWYALRGQEWYDQHYFPLNEQTEELFKLLDHLESRPALAGFFASMGPHLNNLAQAVVDKKKKELISEANLTAAEKLQMKVKEEMGQKTQASNAFKEKAFQATLAAYNTEAAKKKYMLETMKLLSTNATLKPGTTEIKTTSKVFSETYKSEHQKAETDFFAKARADGTLPWSMATAEEIAAKKKTINRKDLQAKYEAKLAEFSKKYHPVKPSASFA